MTTLPRIPLMKIDCNANRGLSAEQMRELDPVYQVAETSRIEEAYKKSLLDYSFYVMNNPMEELKERVRKLEELNQLLKDKLIEKEDIEKRQNKLNELKKLISL
jgi:hypothetical protein